MKGTVFQIQRFSTHDGPGIRSTVFMKGCPLKCFWCHNPESQSRMPVLLYNEKVCTGCGNCKDVCPRRAVQIIDAKATVDRSLCNHCGKCVSVCYAKARAISGKTMTVEEVMEEVLRDRGLYLNSNGGVTFSGGEVLMQQDFLEALLTACHEEGIHTAIETSMYAQWSKIERLLPLVDLWFCDIKAVDEALHEAGTGVGNRRILDNIARLSKSGANIIIRMPLIPGFNDSEEHVLRLGALVNNVLQIPYDQIELLKYNNLGESKSVRLGKDKLTLMPQSDEYIDRLYAVLKKAFVS